MASPNFRLAAKFYSLPESSIFAGDDVAQHPPDSGGYVYTETTTLDYFFPNLPSSSRKWEYLGEPRGLTGFTATWRLDEPGTWSMTISGDRNDPELAAMVAALRPSQADRPRAFAVWQIDAETDDIDIDLSKPFSANLITADTGEYADVPAVLEDLSGRQSWAVRGMSGPILRVRWGFPQPGRVRVVIQGTDWLWALQKTMQVNDYERPAIASSSGGVVASDANTDFRKLVSGLLKANSLYELGAVVASAIGGSGQQIITLRTSDQLTYGQARYGLTTPVYPPVGLYGIVCAFTRRAINHLTANHALQGVYPTPPGQHSLLRVFQRLAERTGLVFRAIGAVVVWDYPGDEENPRVLWRDGRDCQNTDLDDHIPEATNILSKHGDYRRDWVVSLHAPQISRTYGFIQSSNVSAALKPQDLSGEIAYGYWGASATEAEIQTASDLFTLADIQAQNEALLLAMADNLSGTTQPLWGDNTQFAVSFDLSDSIAVEAEYDAYSTRRAGITSSTDRRGLICWQVQITFNARAWGCTTGLNARADVAPEMLPYSVDVPAPKKKKPKQVESPVSPAPTPPAPPAPTPPAPPAPFDEGSETPPGAGEPPLPPAPFDEGSETPPGAGEPPPETPTGWPFPTPFYPYGGPDWNPTKTPQPKPAPHDPGSEYVWSEPPAKKRVPNPAEARSKGSVADYKPQRTPNPAEARSKAPYTSNKIKKKPRRPNPAEARSKRRYVEPAPYDPGSEFLG